MDKEEEQPKKATKEQRKIALTKIVQEIQARNKQLKK